MDRGIFARESSFVKDVRSMYICTTNTKSNICGSLNSIGIATLSLLAQSRVLSCESVTEYIHCLEFWLELMAFEIYKVIIIAAKLLRCAKYKRTQNTHTHTQCGKCLIRDQPPWLWIWVEMSSERTESYGLYIHNLFITNIANNAVFEWPAAILYIHRMFSCVCMLFLPISPFLHLLHKTLERRPAKEKPYRNSNNNSRKQSQQTNGHNMHTLDSGKNVRYTGLMINMRLLYKQKDRRTQKNIGGKKNERKTFWPHLYCMCVHNWLCKRRTIEQIN